LTQFQYTLSSSSSIIIIVIIIVKELEMRYALHLAEKKVVGFFFENDWSTKSEIVL